MKKALLMIALIAVLCVGCGGPKQSPLPGEWFAEAEISYLNLIVKDGNISGEIAEEKGRDVMQIKGAAFAANVLDFTYEFGDDKKLTVIVKLTLNKEGNVLEGTANLKGEKEMIPLKFEKKSAR